LIVLSLPAASSPWVSAGVVLALSIALVLVRRLARLDRA
jgi:hypothetical protein